MKCSAVFAWMLPHRVFFMLSMLFGMAYLAIVPPFRAPDEAGHYLRVLAYAHGEVWEQFQVKKGYIDFFHTSNNARPSNFIGPVRDKWEHMERILASGQGEDADTPVPVASNGPSVALYSPVAYLPAIAAGWVLLMLDSTPPVLFYGMRLALLLSSSWLIAWAIRRMPFQQWTVVAVMLWPTATWSRGMLTADSLTTAFGLAFTAIALQEAGKFAKRREITLLSLSALAVALSKIVFATLLGLLFLPGRFRAYGARWKWGVPLLIGGGGAVVALAWNMAAGKALQRAIDRGDSGLPSNPPLQIKAMMEDPLLFPRALYNTVTDMDYFFISICKTLIGVLGELDVPLSDTLCWALAAAVLVLLFLNAPQTRISSLTRLYCGGIFLATFVLTMLALYLQWNWIASARIEGFQGRYLLPVMPLLIFAISPPAVFKRMPLSVPLALTVIIAMVGNVAGVEALRYTYYM